MNWITGKKCSAAEAAEMIHNGDVLGVSGFTLAGYPKAVPLAIASRAERLHEAGQEFKVTLFAGASTGDSCDGALARAKALSLTRRTKCSVSCGFSPSRACIWRKYSSMKESCIRLSINT